MKELSVSNVSLTWNIGHDIGETTYSLRIYDTKKSYVHLYKNQFESNSKLVEHLKYRLLI